MSQTIATQNGGIITSMAHRYGLEANRFLATIQATVFPQGKPVTLEQTAAFLVVANQYNLNPFIKEIYAFPGRGGGIVPIVSVDGWATLINRQEMLDGIEFQDHLAEEGKLTAVTCRIYRKDRSHPTEVTEYMNECHRDTDTWRKWPSRMLRHKAMIQAARYAFGLVGIYDPDEAERIAVATDAQPEQRPEMPKRKSEASVIDAEVVVDKCGLCGATDLDAEILDDGKGGRVCATRSKPKPVDEKAEAKKLRKIITLEYDEKLIDKHTGNKDIAALTLDELVTLRDALEESKTG